MLKATPSGPRVPDGPHAPPPPRHAGRRRARASVLPLRLAAAAGAAAAPSIAGTKAEIDDLGREVAALDIRVGQAVEANNLAIDRLEAAERALEDTRGELSGRPARPGALADVALRAARGAVRQRASPRSSRLLLTTGSLTAAEQTGTLLDQVARRDAGVVVTVRERRARLQRWSARQAGRREGARRRAGVVGRPARRGHGRWWPTGARCSPTRAPS